MELTEGKGIKRERGQGMSEFALSFPIFLMLILGVIEAGWMMFFFADVSMAAREAARYGATLGDSGQTVAGKAVPHYGYCYRIRDAAIRIASLAGVTDRETNSQIKIYYDSGPGKSTPLTEYCKAGNTDTTVKLNLGDRLIVKIEAKYQPLANVFGFPGTTFKTESAYTIMTDIKISK
jgi:Flp pilus assembly protein TadG